ncbi:MAG TPA: hypothetical protein VKE51_00540 [Vicinamibacterales bacterium]|nr:hypothetical protein [Vicinamibacterales bacterium]
MRWLEDRVVLDEAVDALAEELRSASVCGADMAHSGAVFMDIPHFAARVLVVQAARGC